MQKRVVMAALILLLTPGLFAVPKEPEGPGFDLPRIVKRLIRKITTFDEILTGTKP